ncbi:hypothetical protein [Bradyrhizobium sp.]|uniref:hypothetical protein n=1 Tax=Bradyrhizobium sp. TaxID=376 RepID=UPI003C40E1B5
MTIAKRPSWKSTGRMYQTSISEKTKEIYFSREGWTGGISLKRLAKLAFPRGNFLVYPQALSAAASITIEID